MLFKFAPHASDEDRARIMAENESLGPALAHLGVESAHCKPILPGAPAAINKGYDVASIIVLKDMDSLQAFRQAPLHGETIGKHKPFFAGEREAGRAVGGRGVSSTDARFRGRHLRYPDRVLASGRVLGSGRISAPGAV